MPTKTFSQEEGALPPPLFDQKFLNTSNFILETTNFTQISGKRVQNFGLQHSF